MNTVKDCAVLVKVIEVSELNLADWIAIAIAAGVNNPYKWAYFRWVEIAKDKLTELSITDWEQIEKQCGFNSGWAYFQLKDHQKSVSEG